MLSPGLAKKVTIHLNEDTSSRSDFLSREILSLLLREGVAGATVVRPEAGFGSHHRIHTQEGGIDTAYHMPLAHRVCGDRQKGGAPSAVSDGTGDRWADRSSRYRDSENGCRNSQMKSGYVRILAGGTISWALAWAQTPVVSLAQAEQTALRNHPQIASAALEARGQRIRRAGSARGLLSDPLGQRYRSWLGTWLGVIGRGGHYFEHLQPRGHRHCGKPVAHRFRAHCQPGGKAPNCEPPRRNQDVTNTRARGADRSAAGILPGAGCRSRF